MTQKSFVVLTALKQWKSPSGKDRLPRVPALQKRKREGILKANAASITGFFPWTRSMVSALISSQHLPCGPQQPR